MIAKLKQLWNSQMPGGITTYILLLFGMGFILYMFGFKSFMEGYFANATVNGTSMTNPNLFYNSNPLDMLLKILQSNAGALLGIGTIVSALAIIGTRLIFGSGTVSAVVTYVIPILFLVVFLNLFVFPIATMQADLQSFDIAGLPATAGLFAFFNLFLIFAIIDFVRGGQT